jgi:hypothetical protein
MNRLARALLRLARIEVCENEKAAFRRRDAPSGHNFLPIGNDSPRDSQLIEDDGGERHDRIILVAPHLCSIVHPQDDIVGSHR